MKYRSFFSSREPGQAQSEVIGALALHANKSIFLAGPTGTGKTALLWHQYRMLIDLDYPVIVYKAFDLIEELMLAALQNEYSEAVTRSKSQDRLHVFIDDISAVVATDKANDYRWPVLQRFFDDIADRSDHISLTITSMLDLNGLKTQNKLPVSVIRRLDDICEQKKLTGWKKAHSEVVR